MILSLLLGGWKALLGFLRAIPWQVWVALGLALALWWAYGAAWQRGYDVADAEGKAAVAALHKQLEADRQQAITQARNREAAHRAELDAIAARHAQEMRDAEATAEAVAAGLRAGTVRLRNHWQGCENAKARVPATAGATAEPDAGAELRIAGARDLVRIGAECDAAIRGLQSVIRAGQGQ